jgi:hypothetical protein
MNLINNNPYRILGLPITATEREIAKQINTLSIAAEMGKQKKIASDLSYISPVDRSPELVEEAKKQIEQSENKFLYSLFWFWIKNSADELALEVLQEGNTTKAIEILEKYVLQNQGKVFSEELIYENLVKQSKMWSEQKNDDHNLSKIGDKYFVERLKETSYSIPSVITKLKKEDNWCIEFDSEWIHGVTNIGYGVVLGRDNSSFYSFEITGNGYFMFSKFQDWNYCKIMDWEKNEAINKQSFNHIRLKKIDNLLSCHVNNVLVKTIEIENLFGISFGFKVTNNQKISFSNFKVVRLVEDTSYGEGLTVTERNYSCIKNLSILYLSLAIIENKFVSEYFIRGITIARYFFSSNYFEDYSKLTAGDKYLINKDKTFNFFLTEIIDSIKPFLDRSDGITTGQFYKAFSGFPPEAAQILNLRFVAKQIQSINNEIEISEKLRKKSAITATRTGIELIRKTKTDLIFLKEVLGESHFQFQIIADKLSLEIFQCGIDAFNVCKDEKGDVDYPKAIQSEELYLDSYEYAYQIAESENVRTKAKENLDSCKEYINDKQFYYCWFCQVEKPSDKSKFEVTIYKETSRSYSGVKYQYLPLSIPRCPKCRSFHFYHFNANPIEEEALGSNLIGLLIVIIMNIIFFTLGHFFSFIFKTILKSMDPGKAKIKLTSHSSIKHFPPLNKMLMEGWKFSKPKA